jgi:hypothetical protein
MISFFYIVSIREYIYISHVTHVHGWVDILRLYSKKNMVYGTLCAGADYNSHYLMVNSIVSYPPSLQREKGWSGEDLSYLLSTYVSVFEFSKPVFDRNTSTEKGEGRGES